MGNLISFIAGCLVAWLIAHLYYRRASAETEQLRRLVADVDEEQARQAKLMEVVHARTVTGTPDDPVYPYK
jgi:uncharacterized membrane protein YdjX (TVP38/TMEM64 family)